MVLAVESDRARVEIASIGRNYIVKLQNSVSIEAEIKGWRARLNGNRIDSI
jgi:hypothetical protein